MPTKFRATVDIEFQGTPDVQLVKTLLASVLSRSDAFFVHGAVPVVSGVSHVTTDLNDLT